MARDEAAGCGVLLLGGVLLLLVLVVVAFWQQVLVLALLIGLVLAVVQGIQAQRLARLRGLVQRVELRFCGDACRDGERFARLEGIAVEPTASGPLLRLSLAGIGSEGERLELERQTRLLPAPTDLLAVASNLGFSRWLEGQGITLLSDLAVEAKAIQAALTCLEEVEWAQGALATIGELIASAETTLAKARGNELLEAAIPQLEQALESFRSEQGKLNRHDEQGRTQLRKLHDFLSVPETLRPILRFDLTTLFDPARLQGLKESFAEVVVLNDSFQALSRDRLA